MMKRRILLLIGLFALVLVVLCAASPRARAARTEFPASVLVSPWRALPPATCMPDHCFCERVRPGVICQPINTWSNLGFVSAGLVALATAVHDFTLVPSRTRANPMLAHWIYPVTYGTAAILIGLGSMVYHSSLAFFGQVIDVLAMYLLTSFMVVYNLSRLRRMRAGVFVGVYLLANVVSGYASIRWPVLRRYIFVLLLLGVLATEVLVRRVRHPRGEDGYFAGALASLVLACTAWVLDITRAVCAPDSWLQAHALWHVFMAAAIGCVYFYYRSEVGSMLDLRR
jgi:hypothetical protein